MSPHLSAAGTPASGNSAAAAAPMARALRQVVVLTGASSGIGGATAFAARGASLVRATARRCFRRPTNASRPAHAPWPCPLT